MICTEVGIAEVVVGERRDDIRRMLVERRRELLNEIQSRVRECSRSRIQHEPPLNGIGRNRRNGA